VARPLLALVLSVIIPACSEDTAPTHLGWAAPATLEDSTYANGHPLALNASQDAALEDAQYLELAKYRAALGLPPLMRDLAAEALARAYSKHMSVEPFFSHTDPEGDELDDRALRASGHYPYIRVRENLYYGASAAGAMAAFIASPTHRANLEATDITAVGIGVWFDGATYYVTQEFFYR
jgi:uncharacterized protein YkwD